MLDKLKKFGTDVKEKTGRNVDYVKGKAQGFKHPDNVEKYIQVLRWNRDQIPKLQERVQSLAEKHKDLAQSENKAAQEYAVLGGHEQEHPQLANYIHAFGDSQAQIAEQHFLFHAKIDEIKADWKMMESKDLAEIEKMHDRANRALTDARYWRTHSNPSKMQDSESKYKQYSAEMVDMIERLREKKEQMMPDYIRRLGEAQVEFYRAALEASQRLVSTLDSVGPVVPSPVQVLAMDFDIAQGMEEDPNTAPQKSAVKNPYGLSQAPPASVSPPPRPGGRPQARGMYQFVAQNADELSFNPGDVLTIVDQNGDWWTAELNGRRGVIPGNYVQMM